MQVKELVERLQKLEQDLDVVCYCEDETLTAAGVPVAVFEILDVSQVDAQRSRDSEHKPRLRFGRTSGSHREVIIEITSDA